MRLFLRNFIRKLVVVGLLQFFMMGCLCAEETNGHRNLFKLNLGFSGLLLTLGASLHSLFVIIPIDYEFVLNPNFSIDAGIDAGALFNTPMFLSVFGGVRYYPFGSAPDGLYLLGSAGMFFFQPVVRAMVGYQFARSPGIVIDLAGGLFGPSIVPIEPYLNASIGFSFDSAVPEATGSGNLDLDMADRFLNDRFILIPEKAAEVRIPMENLDTNSRLGLYEKYRQEAWKGILFNAVLPGVGSLLIGDTGSSLLIWGGFGVAVLAFGGVAAVGLNDPKGVNPASGAIQTVLILFSILDLGCSYGYGLFSPVPFVEKWNSQLRNSLMLQGSGFSLQPDGNKAVNAYAFHLDIYQFEF